MAEEKIPADGSGDLTQVEDGQVEEVPVQGRQTGVPPEHAAEDDPDEVKLSKKINHKFDRRIIPWIFGIWLFAFIDRSNIGNARIVGLVNDLHIESGRSFNLALLVFYIPYVLVDVPSNWIVKRVKAGIYLPALITAWGLVSTFLGFTKSLAGLIVARLLLGLFEGGLLGGIVVYLAMFYRRHDMLRRIGFFYCAAPLSGAFGGLLATGLAEIRYGGYNRWPWIFFIEGAVTTLFGILCFFFMPHTPSDAKFLTVEERERAMRRMKLDSHGASATDDVNEEKFDWHWVRMAFSAPQLWFCCVLWFFLLIPLYSFSLFLPTIIAGLQYPPMVAQLFTVPPNITAFVVVLATSFLSDHIKARGPLMASCCLVAIIGYILLLAAKSSSVRYGGTFLVATGVFPNSAMVLGWMSNNLAPHYVRATGIGFLIAFANTSAFISTFIYLDDDKPDYVLGHSISLGALALCFLTICAQIFWLTWENRKRAAGKRDYRLRDPDDAGRLGHLHPGFRYTI